MVEIKSPCETAQVYIDPLQRRIDNDRPILDQQELRTLFFQWEVLIQVHTELLQRLDKAENDTSKISEIFHEYASILSTYSAYYANYSLASRVLRQARQNPRFVKLCKVREIDFPRRKCLHRSLMIIHSLRELV